MLATLKQLGKFEFWRTPDRQKSVALVISTVLHIGLVLLAGRLWLPQNPQSLPAPIDSRWRTTTVDPPRVESLETLEPTFPVLSDVAGGGSSSVPASPSAADPLATVFQPGHSATMPIEWFAEWRQTGEMAKDVGAAPASPRSSSEEGTGAAGDRTGDGGRFFGLGPAGRRFVYVIDCSLSMNHPHSSEAKTRFRRVKLELVSSIGGLAPDQQFFMIFFNDEAHPMPANGLVPASTAAKKRYLYWMQAIQANGLSDPTDAFRMALELRPDVIYFLTDGAFPYKTERELLELAPGKTIIHTYAFAEQINDQLELGMELIKKKDLRQARKLLNKKELRTAKSLVRAQELLETLAAKHGGEFHLIP